MDDRLRRLERAAAGGDPDAIRALDNERLRAGAYSIRDLELAAWLGRLDLIARFGLDPTLETGARYMAFTRPVRPRMERIYDTEHRPDGAPLPQTGLGGAITIMGGQATGSGAGGSVTLIGGPAGLSSGVLIAMNDWFHGLLRFGGDPYYRAMLSLGELGYQVLCDDPFEVAWVSHTGLRSIPDDRVLCRQLLDTVRKWLDAGMTTELARECGQIIATWPTDIPYRHAVRAGRRGWWVELGRAVFTGITSTAYNGVVSVLLGHEIVRTPTALRRICADLMPKTIPPQTTTDYEAPP